jgi:predicted phage tail component-like protein
MIANEFVYKGVSSKNFKIISQGGNRPLLPKMRPRLVEIFGKNGAIDYGQNDYGTRQIMRKIAYIGDDLPELRTRAREIASWLSSKQWGKLIFGDEPDKYYLARINDQVGLENLLTVGKADITFECQPFAQMVISTASDLTWVTADFPWAIDMPGIMVDAYRFPASSTTFFIAPFFSTPGVTTFFTFSHPGTQELSYQSPQGSQFNVVVTGSWETLGLHLNGKTIEYTAPGTGTLIIDSVNMEVTLNGVNKLDAITGDLDSFLTAVPGENTIQISGTVFDVILTLDLVPMWL